MERKSELNQQKPSDTLQTAVLWYRFLRDNLPVLKGLQKLEKMRSILVRANVELGKLSYHDPIYMQRVREFNAAMIESTKGKWYLAQSMESKSKEAQRKSSVHINQAYRLGKQIYKLLCSGSQERLNLPEYSLNTQSTEITFADGIPLVPAVNPVVILKGSDFEMGYQYAQQLIQIFGAWILERKSKQPFNEDEKQILSEWEAQLKTYAPEILEMCRGWSVGATEAGIPMSYEDVLDIWTGHLPPAKNYIGKGDAGFRMPSPLCSGAAAWGTATRDGKLVTGSSGDHDPTYMVTIIAFPKTGNNFIITPFSAIGDVPMIGNIWMMGHGGMNSKGLAYVHHGGDPKMVEPKQSWGYGLRKGAAIFHLLRFANNAREALEMELSYPVGDAGRSVSTAGGFFADREYGYVLESRKFPVIIREAGVMGEKDFLYANNGAIHPDVCKSGWMQAYKWSWDPHGGWYPKQFKQPSIFSMKKKDNLEAINDILGLVFTNNRGRNLYMFNQLSQAYGHIDFEFMKSLFRRSGAFPTGSWNEIKALYKKSGQWGEISTGHAGNAVVTIMKPEEGIYSVCVSTAKRGLTPNAPNPTGGPIYGETNAFFELKLEATPQSVEEYARNKAEEYLLRAHHCIDELEEDDPALETLCQLIQTAENEFHEGMKDAGFARLESGNPAVFLWAQAARSFTRAQVRALQVCQALIPIPLDR